MTTIAILRQLSAGHAAMAAALRQAADEAEAEGKNTESGKAPAEEPKKRGPKPKAAAAATEVVDADPLAGLTGAAEPAEEAQPVEDDSDPLAGLMGTDTEPEVPAIKREDLAKLLGEMAGLVDGVKGKGQGSKALAALFQKHGSENLKTLAEEEFLGVKNEATAIIEAIKKMKQ